jgi:poly [ADP-ribose] polymerase 2/3/4
MGAIMGRVAKLICTTQDNHNKFYDMVENPDGSITSTWGRVDVTSTVTHYPVGKKKWETLLKSKLKKGYVDVTELRAVETTKTDFSIIGIPAIAAIVKELQAYANKSVQQNYTISSEAVTPQMIISAQTILDDLIPLLIVGRNTSSINDKLLELYRVIPRKMKKVQYHLVDAQNPRMKEMQVDKITPKNLVEIQRLISTEQDTLDVMGGQVHVATAQKKHGETKKAQTLLEAMGLIIQIPSDTDVYSIKQFLGRNASQYKKAFKVINKRTQAKFEHVLKVSKNKAIKQYWHGSRNENWWNILDSGLLIRPSNAIHTGSMFGDGIYGANKAQKSIGYCSLSGSYWARGNARKGFLALFDFHVGEQLHVKRHESWMYSLNYQSLRKRGEYDSLFAHGGADLRNDEFIVYKPDQTTIKYLVEIG